MNQRQAERNSIAMDNNPDLEIEPGVVVLGIVFAASLLGLIFWLAS